MFAASRYYIGLVRSSGMRGALFLASLAFLAACAPKRIHPVSAPPGAVAHTRRIGRFKAEVRIAPFTNRTDLTLAQVGKLPVAARKGLKTQGITLIKRSMAVNTRFTTATRRGSVQAWFDAVTVELAIDEAVIHIPTEYPAGSCEYRAIFEHERKHARLAGEKAKEFRERLEDAMIYAEDLPTAEFPMKASDAGDAAEQLKRKIAAVTDPVYREFEESLDRAQDELDRPDPYDAVYKACSGWR